MKIYVSLSISTNQSIYEMENVKAWDKLWEQRENLIFKNYLKLNL